MTRIIAAAALAALAFTATAHARVTYGMNGDGSYTGSGIAECNDGTMVSFQCDGIAGINPWNSGDFQSTPDSTGISCAAAACNGHGGVDLISVVFEIDNSSPEYLREGRLGETEILTSRLVDRAL